MNRREALACLLAWGAPLESIGQTSAKVWRVGIVWGGTKATIRANEQAFLAGMKEYGYQIGRNLVVDMRYADGRPSRYDALVDEVIALRPDALLGANTGVALAMKRKTATTPIVLGTSVDPVGDGLVRSLARPEANVTGISLQLVAISGKHIEIMTELLPGMSRVALLLDTTQPKNQLEQYEQNAAAAARAKGIALEVHRADTPDTIRQAFRDLEKRRPDALLIGASPQFNALRREISKSAIDLRLPSIGFTDDYTEDGGLISYSPSFVEAIRRTAYFMDRIFRGAKPGDLPIEQPIKFSLVLNAKTAKAIGVKVPQSVLLRADRVIE